MAKRKGTPEMGLLPLLLHWTVCFCVAAGACFIAAGADPDSALGFPSPKPETCNYTIIVETTCTKGAGTSDHVSLRFGDATPLDILVHPLKAKKHARSVDREADGGPGSDPAIVDDMPNEPFRECSTDVFQTSGTCVRSPICYLYLAQRGEDRWRPGRAQVLVTGSASLSSGTFYFRRFLPRNAWYGFDACEARLTPFGRRPTRKVFARRHQG